MTDLANRLLSSIENHGKSAMKGIYKLYPHETKKNIDDAIDELVAEGWAILRPTMTVGGDKVDVPNVRRSTKQMWKEPKLFGDE